MRLKPRAARRLVLLGVLLLVCAIAAVGLIGVRSWQKDRRSQKLRRDGMAAVQARNDAAVVDNLGSYLHRKPNDREAWIAFADARERLEEPGGKHLGQTLLAYSRAWALDESDKSVARKLLKLYNTMGQYPEARDLAMRLRPRNAAEAGADMIDVLREEIFARNGLKAFDSTLDQLTKRLVELQPEAYGSAFSRISYLVKTDRRQEAVALAEARAVSRPDDASAALLRQLVLASAGAESDKDEFVAALCKAAGLDPAQPIRLAEPPFTETEFGVQLVRSFDSLNMHLHSLLVLKDLAVRLKDDDSQRLLARRTWMASVPSDLIQDLSGADKTALHAEVLGFLGLSYRDMGDSAGARSVLATLRARDRNAVAQIWSTLLEALLEKSGAREAMASIDMALKQDPKEPVFMYFKAEMLSRLGRSGEARQLWIELYKSSAAEGWAAPAVRIAETLLDEGRLDDGLRAAGEAFKRCRSSAAANLVVLRAQSARVEAGRMPANPAAALAELESIIKRLDELHQPETAETVNALVLPCRIALLCELGRKTEAVQILEAMLAKPESLSPELARRLAGVSIRARLGVEDKLLAATASGKGSGDPGTLLTRALMLESAKQRDAADKLIADTLAGATAESKPQIEIVRAQFLDAIGDARALEAWKQLIADYPISLPAHVSTIRSNAVSADLAFVERVTTALTSLGGSDANRPSTDVRLARCRALLHGAPTSKSREEALALLKVMMLESPGLEARNLFIDALLIDDADRGIRPDYPAAIEQLTAAAAVAPNRGPYTLRLAGVLQRQGRSREAVAELSKLAIDTTADRGDRLQAIDRLSGLLETDTALRAVESMLAEAKNSPTDLMSRRAILLATLRRDREAIAAYKQLVDKPTDDVDVIVSAAGGLRALGDAAGSNEAVKLLDQPGIPPFRKAIALGQLAATDGDYSAAHAHFVRATELAPDDARGWSVLARLAMQRGETAQAEAAATDGLKHLPGNAELSIILQQARLASQSEAGADLSALAEAIDKVPGMQRRAAALRNLEKTRQEGKLDDAATLVKLGEEFSDDSTTQLFISRRLSSLKPPRNTEAAKLLRRAATRFPSDPGIQEQAARTLIMVGDWDPALAAATAWRALTRSPEADLAVAETHLALKRPRPAQEALARYRLPPPPTIPDTELLSLGVLNVRTRALCLQGDAKAAFQLVQPYLPTAAVRRTIALPAAADIVEPLDAARQWLEQIAAASKADDVDEQLAVVGAWDRVASRFPANKADLIRRALAFTDPLIASEATADIRVFQARAELLAAIDDTRGAIAAGRAALAKDPNRVDSLLGLANLLLASADPTEAAAFARRAVELSPDSPAPLIVLATAHLRQADARAAAGDHTGQASSRKDAAAALTKFAALNLSDFAALAEMAMVAERLEDLQTATKMYERAMASPQAPTDRNLAILKNNLAFAMYSQAVNTGSKDSLRRAKDLVEEAIRIDPLADFYDSLGAIDAELGDRAGAIVAYRRALSLNPKSYPSSVGLSRLLVEGTPDERTEAASLIKDLDQVKGAVESLSPDQRKRLQEARAKLAGH